jgi:hypothetical protein
MWGPGLGAGGRAGPVSPLRWSLYFVLHRGYLSNHLLPMFIYRVRILPELPFDIIRNLLNSQHRPQHVLDRLLHIPSHIKRKALAHLGEGTEMGQCTRRVVKPTSDILVDDVERCFAKSAHYLANLIVAGKRALGAMKLVPPTGFVYDFENLLGRLFRSLLCTSAFFSLMGNLVEENLPAECYGATGCPGSDTGKPIKPSHNTWDPIGYLPHRGSRGSGPETRQRVLLA